MESGSLLDRIKGMGMPDLFKSAKSDAPSASTMSGVRSLPPPNLFEDGSDVKSIVIAAARRNGVPEDLALKMSGAESGYDPKVRNKTGSSAKGLFQFIDSTWTGMGGRPGEQFDPYKNADLGTKYIKQNIDKLHQDLGRDVDYGEVYGAHYFGPGVTSMLKNANPNASIERGLSTFHDKGGVAQVMRQNPNLRGKTVGEVLRDLQGKVGAGTIRAPKRMSDASGTIDGAQMASADDYEQAWNEPDDETAKAMA